MWLAHTFVGRKLSAIDAPGAAQRGQYAVRARVKGDAPPAGVRLLYACNPATVDWRKAKRESVPMNRDGETQPSRCALAYYVEVEDESKAGRGS